MPDLTYHGLRHFYASALIRSGLSSTDVAARLGNTSSMVEDTYAHLCLTLPSAPWQRSTH